MRVGIASYFLSLLFFFGISTDGVARESRKVQEQIIGFISNREVTASELKSAVRSLKDIIALDKGTVVGWALDRYIIRDPQGGLDEPDTVSQDNGILERIKLKQLRKVAVHSSNSLQQSLVYLPSNHLAPMYSAARCLIYPSLIEGFGLPVLESYQCGTPVVCSHEGSLPEVAGDGALYIPSRDTEAISDALQRILSDDNLRSELRHKAMLQADKFSWARVAEETFDLYKQFA